MKNIHQNGECMFVTEFSKVTAGLANSSNKRPTIWRRLEWDFKYSGTTQCAPAIVSKYWTQNKRKQRYSLFSGVPLMECCHVDDTSSENTIVGLPPGWVDTDVCRLYISINPPQLVGGTWAPSRSPPVSWWSERHTDSSVMILPGIWTCHVAKEAQPSFSNTGTWNWRAAISLPHRDVGNVSSLRDPKDFSKRPCVKGIQSPSKSLCDSPVSYTHLTLPTIYSV